MSVSSLTRMTVPLASDQSSSSQGLLMPKLKYRFRVLFENMGVSTPRTELTKQVVTCDRPTPSFADVSLHTYNSVVKLAGKPSWNDIKCSIRDDASGLVAKIVGEQLQKQYDFMEQSSASSGIDYKFLTRIEMLDGGNGAHEPTVLETWELYGCYLKSVGYGSLDYASSDAVTLDLSLAYDNALQTPLGSGLGTDIGRTIGYSTTG